MKTEKILPIWVVALMIIVILGIGCQKKAEQATEKYTNVSLSKYKGLSQDVVSVFITKQGRYKLEEKDRVYESAQRAYDDQNLKGTNFIFMQNPKDGRDRILFNIVSGKKVSAYDCIVMVSFKTGERILMNPNTGETTSFLDVDKK